MMSSPAPRRRSRRIDQLHAIDDELTDETGLVASETVLAFRASAPEPQRGGLPLAQRMP